MDYRANLSIQEDEYAKEEERMRVVQLMSVSYLKFLWVFIGKVKSSPTFLHDDCRDGQVSNLPHH